MDMITVLNTIPAVEGNNNWILIVFGLVLGIIFLLVSISTDATKHPDMALGSGIVCVLCVFAFTIGLLTFQNDSPEKYQCTIDNGADAKTFVDTFEIDSQEGLIYTVYLKADEK